MGPTLIIVIGLCRSNVWARPLPRTTVAYYGTTWVDGAIVDISPSSQPDWALSALKYELTPNCNFSQSCHGHMPPHAPTPLVTLILI
jgi:hypothetical protein